MGQRSLQSANQMNELEMDHQGYLHPEPCILLGSMANFPQPDMQTMIGAPGNTNIFNVQHPPGHCESAMFYGMPQYHAIQHHPHHAANLDLPVASMPNFHVPYMNPSSGILLSCRSCDQLPSSSNYGALGLSADEYRPNVHFMDDARGSSKRKNAEGNPSNFQYFDASASSSSSVGPMNTRHSNGVALTDAASFGLLQYGGNCTTIREVGSHRSVRNRLGAPGLDPVLSHNRNQFIQGSFVGQPFQPAGSLWLDQQPSSSSTEAGAPTWSQAPPIPYMHGSNVLGCPLENGNSGLQRYHETTTSGNNANFLHPSLGSLRHHNFHHLSPPIQGMMGQNINVLPQVPAASFRVPTNYPSHSAMNPSHDGLDVGRHSGSVQPTGLRIYRPHREGIAPEATVRHRSLPHLRILPTDGVALLEFPDYYEVEDYVDHHRDMRLDIEDMSYEELLALGERIGNVNTGLSKEIIGKMLKTRTYMPSQPSITLEEAATMDQEPDSCIICQDHYKTGSKIGALDCGHEYHVDCLTKWLLLKNVCPICKFEVLNVEKKDVEAKFARMI